MLILLTNPKATSLSTSWEANVALTQDTCTNDDELRFFFLSWTRFTPRAMGEKEQPAEDLHFVGRKDELIEAKRSFRTIEGRDVLIIHHQGVFYAIDCYCYREYWILKWQNVFDLSEKIHWFSFTAFYSSRQQVQFSKICQVLNIFACLKSLNQWKLIYFTTNKTPLLAGLSRPISINFYYTCCMHLQNSMHTRVMQNRRQSALKHSLCETM